MNDNTFYLIALSGVVTSVLLFAVLWWAHRRHARQVSALKLLFKEQQRQISGLEKQLHELRCGALGVGNRVQHVEGKLAQALERQDELAKVNNDPQSKLYGHAMKMIELGASIDEIIKECDLPRAEAELLVSLHSK